MYKNKRSNYGKKKNHKRLPKVYRKKKRLYKYSLANVPTNRYVCMEYVVNFTMATPASVNLTYYRISANDLFNVIPDLNPNQSPIALNAWQAFYKKWYVVSSSLTLKLSGAQTGLGGDGASLFCVYGGTSDQSVTVTDPIEKIAAQARTKLVTVQPFYNNPSQVVKSRCNVAKLFGIKDIADVVETHGDSDTGIGPISEYQAYYYLVLTSFPQSAGTANTINVSATVRYCTVFNDAKYV